VEELIKNQKNVIENKVLSRVLKPKSPLSVYLLPVLISVVE
jgi:hypothetical protein